VPGADARALGLADELTSRLNRQLGRSDSARATSN